MSYAEFKALVERLQLMDDDAPGTLYNAGKGSVGSGWFPLLERLFTQLRQTGWNGTVGQIKEKFGTLRVYLSRSDTTEAQYQLVHQAERDSSTICEECGATGKLRRRGGWYLTRCAPCAAIITGIEDA